MKFRFQYIYITFLLSFAILTVLAVLFYQRLMNTQQYSNAVEYTYEKLYLLSRIDAYMKDAISSERGFLLTQDSALLEPLLTKTPRINPLIDSLRALTFDNNKQQLNINNLKRIVSDRLNQVRTNVNKAALKENRSQDLRLLQSKVLMNDYYDVLRKIESEERSMLLFRNIRKDSYQASTPKLLYAIFVFATVVFVISFLFINRELRKRLSFQQQLQNQVGSLNRANIELEQLTNAQSHHLQEPLRKIQTFTTRLLTRQNGNLNEETRKLLEKINTTAEHMHGLTADMVKYSNLISNREAAVDVDLNYVLFKVAEQVDARLTMNHASLVVANTLPVVRGIPMQLALLFEQLIDNSVKFSRRDVPPVITITHEETVGKTISDKLLSVFGGTLYYKVSVVDNGMGFSNEFAEKIFGIFEKLETQQLFLNSKGIGLAMVKRIMINHGGNISASGYVGQGAVFHLYFPVPNR
ncbi:sensor histidine kinase [Pseudoflavitalea rhizosphaerae]|uniref:sensor histidine kinase n=1 Tax=Pseudoflavitalea rhizosphaerae TaxID=1884793 RepID=UPI000F8ED6C0|nr:sensor histidine kinase [Pseudoflavitalea rhizosphaerae]